jgi:hypothetical protein
LYFIIKLCGAARDPAETGKFILLLLNKKDTAKLIKDVLIIFTKSMSYKYSNKLCLDALRLISSDEDFEVRLQEAFSEMSVSKKSDTSLDIWEEWTTLHSRYLVVSGEIYEQRKEGNDIKGVPKELKELGRLLIDLIFAWIEFNCNQISQDKLSSKE